MIVPNPEFRPNPKRCVYVQGQIDQKMVNMLMPQIVTLQHESREPITVYIDSPGGSPDLAGGIRRLLASPTLDRGTPCRVITVATSLAGSAAADLLSSGDYALAYGGSTIHFHGTRTSTDNPLTVQNATSITEYLKGINDRFAMELAQRCISRFMFRYVYLRPMFQGHRETYGNDKEELDCLRELLLVRVSPRAITLAGNAQIKYLRYRMMHAHMIKRKTIQKQLTSSKRMADLEAVMFKAVIDFELSSNKKATWTLRDGLAQVNDDFLLLRESILRHGDPQLVSLCNRWGEYVLTPEQHTEIANEVTPEARAERRLKLLRPVFQPLWFYFVALCQTLQEGEYGLTAMDTFWLGLIDEVVGEDLPSFRVASEFWPDSKPKKVAKKAKRATPPA